MGALAVLCFVWPFFQNTVPLAVTKPIIDNDRVTVREVTWVKGQATPMQRHQNDSVSVYLVGGAIKNTLSDGTSSVTVRKAGDALFVQKSTLHSEEGTAGETQARSIEIDLKEHPVQPLPNTSGYPSAFPRPGSKKVLENNRVIVWEYTWMPGKPTPMHFHDKDVVVVFLENGALKSTAPDSKSVVNNISFGLTNFNARDRVHIEELVNGKARAIIVELK